MTILAELLARLVVGILAHFHQRQDFRAAVLREVERQGADDALTAMGWKLANPVSVPRDPGQLFPVKPGGPDIRL